MVRPSTPSPADRLRAFVAEHAPAGRFPPDWNSRMARAGFVAPHWPEPWGLAAGPTEQLELDEVARELRLPRPLNPIGIGWAGPTLLVAGSEAQRQRWLPGVLDGSEIWCQLFSEPGAGSDLSSLATRATRDGDEYVVNGQKIWTTLAHVAQWGILLARTDPNAEAHHGITYFVLDMRTPGIEVRPIVQMTGTHEFNEVFFTDVRVPAANIVGAEHDGWRLAKVTLGNERVSLSGEGALWGRGPTANDVLQLVRDHGGATDALTPPTARASLHRGRGSPPDPPPHRLGARPRARTRSRGVGPQGDLRRARPARHGHRDGARRHLRALLRSRPLRRARRRDGMAVRLSLRACADDRGRHERGAAQHPRREGPWSPA